VIGALDLSDHDAGGCDLLLNGGGKKAVFLGRSPFFGSSDGLGNGL
jgi:hypothetical protein